MPSERAPESTATGWPEIPREALSGWCGLITAMTCEVTGRACDGACWAEVRRRTQEGE
jgi:hypothetical protein